MRARVFKFCIHIEGGQVYCGTENKTEIYSAFFFLFSITHSNVIHRKFVTNISQELLHKGFCNLVQVLWIICCFMGKRTRFLLLIPLLISSFFFSPIFKYIYKKKSILFSQGLRGAQSWYLIHTWAKGWSIVNTKNKQPEYTHSFIFLLFSVSLISKDEKLASTDYLNIPLTATAGGTWALLSLCYIYHSVDVKTMIRNKFMLPNITNEPAHEIMVLIAYATTEGSGEPVHSCSLTRAFAVRIHEVWK